MKLLSVAWREFVATVTTKGFIFGVIIFPAIIAAMMPVIISMIDQAGPSVVGTVGIIDRSGALVETDLGVDPDEPTMQEQAIEAARNAGMPPEVTEQLEGAAGAAVANIGSKRDVTYELLPADTDLDAAKAELIASDTERPRLAIVVIPRGSVTAGEDGSFERLEMFVSENLDPEVQSDLRRRVADGVVDARLRGAGMNPPDIRRLMRRPGADATTVTAEGEDRPTFEFAKFLMPIAFMMLLWISVFTAGQFLLYSTIEEKSSRVMEVLLSAVSPMQLMAGKILGQFAVGMVILCVYAGVGVAGLLSMAAGHLIDPMQLLLLAVYFLIAFFSIAAMMAAVGSAVNDVKEANALMGPIMIVLIFPMLAWMPISRAPNSVLAQVLSFLPPISPFIMVVRISGSEEIPVWQIPATIAVGALMALVLVWIAAKIFRIGALMYGKPPNLRTLLRWIRMA